MVQPWPPAAAPLTTTSCSTLSSPPRATAGRRRRTRGRHGSVRINASNPASAYGNTDVDALAATAVLYAPTLLAESVRPGDLAGQRREEGGKLSRRRARRPRYFKCKAEKHTHTHTHTLRHEHKLSSPMVTAPPPPCAAARSGGRDGKAALWRRSSLTRPNPRSTSSTSYFLPNAGHCPLSSLISGMENPLLRLSASPQPLTGAAGHIKHLPSMPLQLPASTSIAFSRSSGHLHGCTPTVRSIDPTDTRYFSIFLFLWCSIQH
uniref:Uncharacterized protein n=1 Tax=Triticum urartu TaxID=4572 RepID=A0A8R7Q4P5_TRIUA